MVYENIVADPHSVTSYKMEVLRNSDMKARPLFRVTSEDGVQVSKITTFFLVDAVPVNNFEESFKNWCIACCIDMYGT